MEELVLVEILVCYPSPEESAREEQSWHRLYDRGPEFETVQSIIETYQEIPDVRIDIWYKDMDEIPPKATHDLLGGIH